MMNINRLKINIYGEPVKGFAGPESIVDALEAEIKRKIPEEYLAFLRLSDGGCPEVSCFKVVSSEGEEVFSINNFFSLNNPCAELLKDALYGWGEALGEGMLPIACDGVDDIIYLDLNYRPAAVWLYLHDSEEKIKVSSDFSGFIESLASEIDGIK